MAYGDMALSDITRLKALDEQNRRLRPVYSEFSIKHEALRYFVEKVLDRHLFRTLNEVRQITTEWIKPSCEEAPAGALGWLNVVMEAYPDLKANQEMIQLNEEITAAENKVAFIRQASDDQVMSYHTCCQSFPQIAVAGMFGMELIPACLSSSAAGKIRTRQVSFLGVSFLLNLLNALSSSYQALFLRHACAAASLATGTRGGEQLT